MLLKQTKKPWLNFSQGFLILTGLVEIYIQ